MVGTSVQATGGSSGLEQTVNRAVQTPVFPTCYKELSA